MALANGTPNLLHSRNHLLDRVALRHTAMAAISPSKRGSNRSLVKVASMSWRPRDCGAGENWDFGGCNAWAAGAGEVWWTVSFDQEMLWVYIWSWPTFMSEKCSPNGLHNRWITNLLPNHAPRQCNDHAATDRHKFDYIRQMFTNYTCKARFTASWSVTTYQTSSSNPSASPEAFQPSYPAS